MGQVGVLLVFGHRHDLGSFLRQVFVKRLRRARPAILKTAPVSDPLLQADDAAVLDHEDRGRAPHRHAVLQGGIEVPRYFQWVSGTVG